ncbi:endonuclease [Leptobacterium flavescens]|uniref:Endonuclease n=1 Tax=Leptobacterium flavescens TaxID=472055 RepID=A0A6P0UJT7_9FLAO|nr:endonuclease/exonuclease/phosphatase family protein [Leptobacterium flavescens]NER12139.1 endonuclease [Leptobacterium flavescens]
MSKLRLVNKGIFLLNSVFAAFLLLSYALPYIFSRSFPSLSVLSLTVPILIVINLMFMLYWILRLKKQFLLSFLILLLGYQHVFSFYKLPFGKTKERAEAVSLMSYNVRLFNVYEWIDDEGIADKISTFLKDQDPDILCLQEFYFEKEAMFDHYPYRYIKYKTENQKTGQAIFSRFPIVDRGSLEFPDTGNNAIYADIVKNDDTVRIYNLHLESLRINPEKEDLSQKNSGRLLKRIGTSFAIQQAQANIFNKHQETCMYKKIVCGDFNNTQYSNIYKKIRGDMKDTFEEAGKGFGKTFDFKYFPVRIDFIMVDGEMEVISHKNFKERYSDHYPVSSSLIF